MKEKPSKGIVDKNYFKATSYEFVDEIGVLGNEDMKNNRKLISDKNEKKQEKDNK